MCKTYPIMITALFVRMAAVLRTKIRDYCDHTVLLIFSLLIYSSQVKGDDQVVIRITDPVPVCFPATVDISQPAITAGSTPGLTFSYYEDEMLTRHVPDPTKVGDGIYYIRGVRDFPFGIVAAVINVRVNTLPTVTMSYAGTPFCIDISSPQSVTLSGTGSFGGGSFSSDSGLSLNAISGKVNAAQSTPGPHLVTYTLQASGGCPAVTSSTTVAINPLPTVSDAGNPQNLCDVNTITLSGNIPSAGTGSWTFVSGPNLPVITDTTLPNTTVTGMITGAYVFRWTITNGTCTPSTRDVAINISASPTTAIAGPAQQLCNENATIMSGNQPVTGTGLWTMVSGPNVPLFADNALYNSSITGMVSGVYVFQWNISNGACALSSDRITITNSGAPSLSDAGPDQNLCNVAGTQLAGNNPVIGTGVWTTVSGPNIPVFTDASLYNTAVTGMVPGEYQFQWRVTSGNCVPSDDIVHINNSAPPVPAVAGTSQNLCGTLLSNNLGGNTPTEGSGAWSILSGGTGTFGSSASGNSSFTADNYGTYVLRWTISNGSCTPVNADITVSFSEPPTPATVGVPQDHCGVLVSDPLGGNTPASGNGLWSIVSGGAGTFSASVNGSSTFTADAYGAYVLRWTISNGACAVSYADIPVNFNQVPTPAVAGPSQNLCGILASSGLGANTPAVGIGTWSIVSGGSGTFSDGSNGNSTFTADSYGSYLLRWTIINGSGCISTADMNVNFYQPPAAAMVGNSQNLCGTLLSNNLGGNTPTEGSGTWSILSGGTGTFGSSASGNSSFTADNYGTYVLRWTISNGSCTPVNADITVSFSEPPTPATVGVPQDHCGVLVSDPLGGNTPASGNGLWSIVSGGTGTFGASGNGSSTFSADAYGAYVLRWTISNGACAVSYADIPVNFDQVPTPAVAGPPQNICGVLASSGLGANTPAVGIGTWSIVSGGSGTFSDGSNGNSTFTADSYGSYLLRWTITNGSGCISTADMNVNFYQPPAAATGGAAQTVCGSLTSSNLGGNNASAGYGQWQIVSGGTGTFSSPASGNSTFSADTYSSYVLRWVISNGTCAPTSADIAVAFSPSPSPASVGPAQSICGSLVSAPLGGNLPVTGTGAWSIVSGGSGSFSSPGDGSSTFTADSYGSYVLRWAINYGICTEAGADVSVNFYPNPVPLTFTGNSATQAGVADGNIDATVAGGTPPYNFLWTGPVSFTSASEDIAGLRYGLYNLVVSDKNGCSQNGSFKVLDPPAANEDNARTIEDKPVTFNIVSNDSDADGMVLSSTIDLDPLTTGQQNSYTVLGKGSFTVSPAGEVTFVQSDNYIGQVSIQYVVNDNDGLLSNKCSLSVQVVLKNQSPVASEDQVTVAEHNTAGGNLFENDLDPEEKPITLESFMIGSTIYTPGTMVTLDDVGTLQINQDGTFTFVPEEFYYGNLPLVSYTIVDNEGLTAKSSLLLTVTPVNDPASAVTDHFSTKEHLTLEGNVLINDFDIDGDPVTLNLVPVQAPENGALTIRPNGDFTYQPDYGFVGNDSFKYQLCDDGNPPLCDEGTVMIVIDKDPNCEVFIPNVFTPNADGAHDYFKIRCLYNYENPEMKIFNRAGALVFRKDHYGDTDYWGSEDQAFWNGRSEHRMNLMNDELPAGTYYYILKLDMEKVVTGFIMLRK